MTSGLGVDKNEVSNTVYELMLDECSINESIHETVVENLKIIPSNVDLSGAEVDLVYVERREYVLQEALNSVKNNYDYIFIDCPPSLGLLTVNALTATNSIIIPIQCEYFALVGLGQLMNTVKLIKMHLNPTLEIEGVLLTMKDARSNLVNQVADEIHNYFKQKVYNTYIPRNIRLAEAPSHGQPINVYDQKSRGAVAYKALAEEFLANNKA